MTFEELYRDIYSKLAIDGEEHDIYFEDIRKTINDSIKSLRIDYVKNRVGYDLSTTEVVSSFSEDSNFPFLNSGSLTDEILSDLPIELTVLNTTAYNTSDTIEDSVQTFSSGDIARKGDILYEAIDDINAINSFNLTFNPRNYRLFWKHNGTSYKEDDVLYDKANEEFYIVTSDFDNNQDLEASNINELDKLYWREIGRSSISVSKYPYDDISNLLMFDSIGEIEGVAINEDTVYSTKGIVELQITYIPKWTDLVDFTDQFTLPDSMIDIVKNRVIQELVQKLGIDAEIQRKQNPIDQEEND